MGLGNKQSKKTTAKRSAKGNKKQSQAAKGSGNHNEHRRKLYNTDPDYREKAKKQFRVSYRKNNPLPESKLAKGLLTKGTIREVFVEGRKTPFNAETFTIREAAESLGKTYQTFRRWVLDDLIPYPIFTHSTTNYDLYHLEELQTIAKFVYKHEKEFCYLHVTHDETINNIRQAVEHLRKNKRWV